MLQEPHSHVTYPHPWSALHKVEKVAATVSGLAVLYLASTESLEWIPFLVSALAIVAALLIRWPYGALFI